MDIEKQQFNKQVSKLIITSLWILAIIVLSQLIFIRELLFEQDKNSIVPQRLMASLQQEAGSKSKVSNYLATFNCKTKNIEVTEISNSMRFKLEGCQNPIKVTNLTNGAEATIYEDKKALITDFLGLNKGRNRILFSYQEEKVDIVITSP